LNPTEFVQSTVRVLDAHDIVLFVSVSVVALPTSVSVASGKSIVLLDPVELLRRVVIIPVPLFETQNRIRFVSSAASQTLTSPVPFPTR
jgi:hypothetical protein